MAEVPESDALSDLLRAREDERLRALVASDMESFSKLLADDIVHVHTTGIVHGKAELLHHAGEFLEFHSIIRGPLSVRAIGPDAAVMTGSMTNVVGRRGQPGQVTVNAFVTQVWTARSGDWRIASFHATRLPDSSTGA